MSDKAQPQHDSTPDSPHSSGMNRREMLSTLGLGAAAATGLTGTSYAMGQMNDDPGAMGQQPGGPFAAMDPEAYDAERGEYVLPALGYAYDALEPHIDAQTMQLHHDIHHAGYVKGLNAALGELAEARRLGDFALVKHWSRQVAFHGSGHSLHTIFWKNMAPPNQRTAEPQGRLRTMIRESFGSMAEMKSQYIAASSSVEGSGWGILAYEPIADQLIILQAEKHHNLTMQGVVPLLVIDVWEHAYYLKYQNRRGAYVEAFWNVIEWADVQRRLEAVAR